MSVTIALAQGQATVGNQLISIREAGASGELQVGGPNGVVLRPVDFLTRSRITRAARDCDDAANELAHGIRLAATVEPGDTDQRITDVLALHLAGASPDRPSFTDCATILARHFGWGPEALGAMSAADTDHLAMDWLETYGPERTAGLPASGADPTSGWQRIVFESPTSSSTSDLTSDRDNIDLDNNDLDNIDSIWRSLVDALLSRATASGSSPIGDLAAPNDRESALELVAAKAEPGAEAGGESPHQPARRTTTWPTVTNVSAEKAAPVRQDRAEAGSDRGPGPARVDHSVTGKLEQSPPAVPRRAAGPRVEWPSTTSAASGTGPTLRPEQPTRAAHQALAPAAELGTTGVDVSTPGRPHANADSSRPATAPTAAAMRAAVRDHLSYAQPVDDDTLAANVYRSPLGQSTSPMERTALSLPGSTNRSTAPAAAPNESSVDELADALARAIHQTADLRGI